MVRVWPATVAKRSEAAECGVEHSTHQQRQSPACKLIVQTEPYVTAVVRSRLKCPTGLQSTQRSIRRLDKNASVGTIERNAADEGFTTDAARNRHVRHQNLGPGAPGTRANGMFEAEWHELGIAFDVGNELEHIGRGMPDMPLGRELRHYRCKVRSAFSRAKSSSA